ncbi:hypothetical protein SBF1_50041 [Candidatus Desulfosporosinus infrequens]|uniref:Uncharacterized protein n=1 Tax=Candidatus Desulfosporosinus infrequens TaxID=2043169 RepID=A0A2U3LGS4_9FIRM|nr:hypothetical protein SBF1_50041 [Candidatus Desulfosporosinus infrequens]
MFHAFTLEQANLREVQGWKVGQHVQVKEWRGTYEIEGYHQYGRQNEYTTVYLAKLKKDGTKSKYSGDTPIANLMPLGAAQPTTDSAGRTALQAAQELFGSGFAKHGWYNTDRESLVKVETISKTGRVKVQDISVKAGITARSKTVDGHKVYSQEDRLVNFADLEYGLSGDIKTFTPRLFWGEWGFWHDGEIIKAPDMKLTWLLD